MKLNTSKGANVNYLAESVHVDKFSTHPNTSIGDVVDNDLNLVDLSKIWHDASEMPKPNKWFIYEAYAEDQDPEYGAYFSAELEPITWGRMTVANEITRWAYVSDLLPKGGEE